MRKCTGRMECPGDHCPSSLLDRLGHFRTRGSIASETWGPSADRLGLGLS